MRVDDSGPKRIRGAPEAARVGARDFRRRSTGAERALWAALRGRRLGGLKFRRQHPLGPYVVDFCCAERRIIVELDGGIHDEQVEYDQGRTQHLEEFGYTVIRFRNELVFSDLDRVLAAIAEAALSRTSYPESLRRERSQEQAPPRPELGEGAGG